MDIINIHLQVYVSKQALRMRGAKASIMECIYIYTVLLHSGVIRVSVYSTPDWWKLHVLLNVSTCKAIPSPHTQKEKVWLC